MEFCIHYDNGYIVNCYGYIANENLHINLPILKFKNEGDAKIFKEHDCPLLSFSQLKALIEKYNPNVKYIRLDENKFKKC